MLSLFHTPPPPPSLPHLSTLAHPLTAKNILTAVQGVAWKKLGKELFPLTISGGQWGYPKLDEIERQHQSDDSRLCAVIECWLQGDGRDKEPSWRRIILALDSATKTTTVADTIRHFAEPLPGKSCDSVLYSVYVLPHIR